MRPNGILTFQWLCMAIAAMTMAACKPEIPSDVISERRMEQILHDYHLAQGMAENTPRAADETVDMLLYDYQHAVFRKYGITEEQFKRSMAFYCSDMDRLVRIYKNVTQRLEREADAFGVQTAEMKHDIYADLTQEGDTANVWADRDIVTLKPKVLENFYVWRIEADSTWLAGDDLVWRFQMLQLSQSGITALEVDMVVVYDNDSVRSAITHITTNPLVELRIKTPDGWQPREITGHAFLNVEETEGNYRLLILHHPILARMHKPESQRNPALKADSLANDTLTTDTIQADTIDNDRRLSPSEFLQQQDIERTIDVVKEKPFDPSTRKRGYPNRRGRRQR